MTDAASWKAVERKARLAGNGLRPYPEAQHRGQPLSGSFWGACNQGNRPLLGLRASTGCSVLTRPREQPRGSNPALQSLERATAIPCGLRLVLNPLGRSASAIITWIEY